MKCNYPKPGQWPVLQDNDSFDRRSARATHHRFTPFDRVSLALHST